MLQTCPRCQRANPAAAVFCHFDGGLLRQGAGPAAGQLLQPFTFPSGRRCGSFDELVQGCYYEWEDARGLLRDGTFVSFLAGVGRADLAKAAREAQGQPDPDIALTNFVAALPATQVQGPKLGLNPRRLVIGPLRVGEQRELSVRVLNEGRGLLQGKVTVSEGAKYLKVLWGEDERTAALKTGREAVVQLKADTTGLAVGQNYSAKLVVVTNGGVAELPVRLDLIARPFAKAPYQGALTPQDLARKMRDNPHPAVAFLESGEVARWFASNGWAYPIAGPTAPGLAAVQQFFEELGLARAPQIVVSEEQLRFDVTAGEVVAGEVTIRSPARKLVYARAESDAPWLRVTAPGAAGQVQAPIGFEIDSTLMDEDRLYAATLKVIANAGQTFHVRVQADVKGNRKSGWFSRRPAASGPPVEPPAGARPAPAWLQPVAPLSAPVRPAPAPATDDLPAAPNASFAQTVFAAALLLLALRLLLVFPADLFARVAGAGAGPPVPGSLEAWLAAPAPGGNFLRLFVLSTWWVGALLSVAAVWRGGGRWTDLLCALLAGAVAGLVGSATAGSLLVLGDALPRLVLAGALGPRPLGPAVATPLWIAAAALCWLGLGVALGAVLAMAGQAGRALLAWLGSPLALLLRAGGLGKTADFFALRAA